MDTHAGLLIVTALAFISAWLIMHCAKQSAMEDLKDFEKFFSDSKSNFDRPRLYWVWNLPTSHGTHMVFVDDEPLGRNDRMETAILLLSTKAVNSGFEINVSHEKESCARVIITRRTKHR